MNRKWIALITALFALLVVTGCGKKAEPVAAPAPIPAAPEPESDVRPQQATPDPVEQEQPPTLAEIEQDIRTRGLLGDVFFEFDRADLTQEARSRLAKNAEFMKSPEGSNLTFAIEGHCDERGTNEYNLALGDRRAQAAKDYLVSLGVGAGRFSTSSFGEERPFCTESSEGCWQQNRRAHFVVSGQ
ncbi:MAG: OmpA family protein [Thermoanaerobaculia bacterium]|nr:OmpA family protein [Thermoanaerobaculia bacterium]